MPILSLDQLVANLSGSQRKPVYKASATAEGAGTYHSAFLLAGLPGAASTPPAFTAGSGYVPTSATAGAIPFTNPVTGGLYLGKLQAALSVAGVAILYDRLWHCSGFNTTTLTAQAITTPGSITRGDVTGDGVEIWGEIYTAPGATGATWTVSYTNQAGTAGRTATYTHPANAESVGQMFPFTLQAGDTGVRSVQSLTCSASSGTAGSLGLTLLRRIAAIASPVANAGDTLDFFKTGGPQIPNDACLTWMILCSTTSSGNLTAEVVLTGESIAGTNVTATDLQRFLAADMFLVPAAAPWPVASPALLAGPLNLSMYREFTKATSDGVGLEAPVATGKTNLVLDIEVAAAASGFAANNGVRFAAYARSLGSSAAFVGPVQATALALTDTTNKQRFTLTFPVASFAGLTTNDTWIVELVRQIADGSDTMPNTLRLFDAVYRAT